MPGGALAGPADGAVFVFRGRPPAVVDASAAADPYVVNGVVREWRVRNGRRGRCAGRSPLPDPFLG